MGDHVKSHAKVETNGMWCSPLVHKISHPIVEGTVCPCEIYAGCSQSAYSLS